VRGAAPGTRETELLSPLNAVEQVHAVLLAGGRRLRVRPGFDADTVRQLVRLLEDAPC